MRVLNLVVAGMVTEVLDGNPRVNVNEVGHGEPLLDEPLGLRKRISTVDEVDIALGEQIEVSDELLGLTGREVGVGQAQARTIGQASRRERREK